MEFPILNKFEKEKKVIEFHKQGKTIRQTAPEVKMLLQVISKIIKVYDKKIRLETKKGKKNIPKTLSISSIFKIFSSKKYLQ